MTRSIDKSTRSETVRLRRARKRRGARRDPALTKSLVLSAARDEFAEYGLNGARVDRIAERIGSSKNLIYHYFGSKQRLYLSVLESTYLQMRQEQKDLDIQSLPPEEGIRTLVANTFEHFVRVPALIRLMSIENIHYASHLRQSKIVKPLYTPLLKTIRTLLTRGQATGIFRRGVDPVDLYISISGLAYFYLSNRHSLSWIFDQEFTKPLRLAQRRDHVMEVILGYLRPVKRRRKPPK